jgi:hypothetical protein
MTRICWRLAEFASQALQPDERDAVLGDFAESGESGGQALLGVLGLFARRQAALWKDWRPWLVLVGLVVPLAWLLSINSRLAAGASAVYFWSYLNNWDWSLLKYVGFWYILRDSILAVLMQSVVLVCWSWSAGFLLGSVSRRIMPANGVLFCVLSIVGQVLCVSPYLAYGYRQFTHRPLPDAHQPISALLFYREVFPVIVQAVFVIVPVLWAMRRAATDLRRLPASLRILALTVASFTAMVMTIREPGLGFFIDPYVQRAIFRNLPRHLWQFLVYWPIAYLLVSTLARRWPKESRI